MKTAKTMFQVYGVFVVFCGLLLLLCGVITLTRALGVEHLDRRRLALLAVPLSVPFVLGTGLMLHHKWAVFVFVSGSLIGGTWLIGAAILSVPFPWSLLLLPYGVAPILASIDMIRRWPELKRS